MPTLDDKKALLKYQEHLQYVRNATSQQRAASLDASDTNKRIERARKDYAFFVATYFPHLAKSKCGKFQIDAAKYIRDNHRARAVFEWARGHAKSSHLSLMIPLWLKIQSDAEPLVMIPENALSYKGHHYYIYNDVKTNWETAASNCRDRGGYMAVINDEEENETLYKYMTAMGYDQAFFGLIYSNTNDDWVYLDGDTSDFRDWGYNSEGVAEPNNAEGWEYHVEFDANMQDGHWNDAKFGTKTYTPDGDAYKNLYTYICEWDR